MFHKSRNNNRRRFYSSNRRRRPARRKPSLNIEMFINKAQKIDDTPEYIIKNTFKDFPFQQRLYENIVNRGYKIPTPIQDQAIMSIINGEDMIGIANTGTGKTGAFLLPLIQKVIKDRNQKILILAPTRELALQIEKELYLFSPKLGIKSVLIMGGTSMRKQEFLLRKRHNFIIGTPGRVKDLKQRKILRTNNIQTIVLDEVDRMLDMGFIKDVTEILNDMAPTRQSLFFSATMTSGVNNLIKRFSNNIKTVSVKSSDTAKTIEQDVIRFREQTEKIEILHKILIKEDVEKVLIFGRTKRGVHALSRELSDRGFKTESIHGNKSQPQRQRALSMFHHNRINILVATDVAARGLDIKDVTHVINYELPENYDDYIHRIGRTGRANKKGKALTFIR